MKDAIKDIGIDLVEKHFPKGECKERGKAIVLYAELILRIAGCLPDKDMIKFCPDTCPFLSITEEEQNKNPLKPHHICNLRSRGERVYHGGRENHPKILRHEDCFKIVNALHKETVKKLEGKS